MPLITCKICGSPLSPAFNARVLGKYDAIYNYCDVCGFLCAQKPHWLAEAYSSAIASTDTGLVARNIAIANQLAIIIYFFINRSGSGRYLDVAGGYGLLTRLMRDYGFDFYSDDKYCQNFLARGFDYCSEIGKCSAVTAFEVLEHTEDPLSFVANALQYGQTDTLIFTTELFTGNPPSPEEWRYYSFETGQHIAFFQRRTLQTLASKKGLNFCSNGWLHIFSKEKISEFLLKAYTGRLSGLALRHIRKNLASLTVKDHDALVNQLNRNRS